MLFFWSTGAEKHWTSHAGGHLSTVFSPRRSLRDVNGHLDSSHSSLMDKQTRTLAER